MNRSDWLTLLVGVPEADGAPPPAIDRVRVQKALFLIGQTLRPTSFYDFQPYHYGPFDHQVYADAESMTGLVDEVRVNGYRAYQAGPEGIARGARLAQQLSPADVDYVRRVRKWVNEQSFNGLVRAIYDRFPEMKSASRFRG